MKCLALIQGGLGPDVWENEITVDGVDWQDIVKQALAKAEDAGGCLVSVSVDSF